MRKLDNFYHFDDDAKTHIIDVLLRFRAPKVEKQSKSASNCYSKDGFLLSEGHYLVLEVKSNNRL